MRSARASSLPRVCGPRRRTRSPLSRVALPQGAVVCASGLSGSLAVVTGREFGSPAQARKAGSCHRISFTPDTSCQSGAIQRQTAPFLYTTQPVVSPRLTTRLRPIWSRSRRQVTIPDWHATRSNRSSRRARPDKLGDERAKPFRHALEPRPDGRPRDSLSTSQGRLMPRPGAVGAEWWWCLPGRGCTRTGWRWWWRRGHPAAQENWTC